MKLVKPSYIKSTPKNYINLKSGEYLTSNGVFTTETDNQGNIYNVRISNVIDVVKSIQNIESKQIQVELGFSVSSVANTSESLVTSAEVISSPNKIESLAAYGVDIDSWNKHKIIRYLSNIRRLKPLTFTHQQLGFYKTEVGEKFFKHHNTVGYHHTSTYSGGLQIEPTGSFGEWESVIRQHVLGNPTMELALVLGFSAALVGYIGEEISLGSMLIHIVGDSTSGKTTASFVAASVFGSPNIRENGLVTSWHATTNALQARLGQNRGVPIVLDEISMAGLRNFTNVIYAFADGREKDRLDGNSMLKDGKKWLTTIISTGEQSMIENSDPNTGIKARLLEFKDVAWTKSAAQSQEIKRGLKQHYGWAGMFFVDQLFASGEESLRAQFNQYQQDSLGQLKKSPITERLAAYASIIRLTIDVIQDTFDYELETDAIMGIVHKYINENIESSDIAETAYHCLLQYVVENRANFVVRSKSRNTNASETNTEFFATEPTGKRYGCLVYSKLPVGSLNEIAFLTDRFKKILVENARIQSPELIVSLFKKRGWLTYDKDKNTRKRQINKKNDLTYVLNIPQIDNDLGINSKDLILFKVEKDPLEEVDEDFDLMADFDQVISFDEEYDLATKNVLNLKSLGEDISVDIVEDGEVEQYAS